jgi:hypothetical protein
MTPLSPHNRFELPLWLKVALGLTFALNVAAVLTCAALLWTNAGTDSQQTTDIAELVREQQHNTLAGCERGNLARKAEVSDLRGDILVLRSDRALLQAVLQASPPGQLSSAYAASIRAKSFAIDRKQRAIESVIRSQAEVAKKPGSPIADCAKAYSLGR